MPCLLYLDTAAAAMLVAITKDNVLLAKYVTVGAKEQSARLNGMIEQAAEQAGRTLGDIDAIAVCGGPGSYTGLRVGLGVAKGLAFALDKKLMLFDRLSLIALSHQAVIGGSACRVVLKARQGEYFTALFDTEGKVVLAPRHIFEPELVGQIAAANETALCITDDRELALPLEKYYLPEDFVPDPETWCEVAERRFQGQDWEDLAYCEPFYLKEAFTTRPKKRIL